MQEEDVYTTFRFEDNDGEVIAEIGVSRAQYEVIVRKATEDQVSIEEAVIAIISDGLGLTNE